MNIKFRRLNLFSIYLNINKRPSLPGVKVNPSKIKKVLTASICMLTFAQSGYADTEPKNAQGFGKFEFALIGDVPYSPNDYWKFDNVIADINADKQLKWVMHAGDIKNGSTLCSDELFADRLQRFQRFEIPFILTPGDNEWTDCHRANNGSYLPLERLALLRDMFYPVPGLTLGQRTMAVETQADDPVHFEFVENTRWMEQHVMFASLHIVGSNNAMADFAGRSVADDDEVARRIEATLTWIEDTFDKAKAEEARGVFLMFQANPGFELPQGDPNRIGFEEILAQLEKETITFKKPVVLAHGDSHYFRMDKPMKGSIGSRRIENATRVETFGSSDVHWLKVVVDPNSKQVFNFVQEIVAENLEQHPLP